MLFIRLGLHGNPRAYYWTILKKEKCEPLVQKNVGLSKLVDTYLAMVICSPPKFVSLVRHMANTFSRESPAHRYINCVGMRSSVNKAYGSTAACINQHLPFFHLTQIPRGAQRARVNLYRSTQDDNLIFFSWLFFRFRGEWGRFAHLRQSAYPLCFIHWFELNSCIIILSWHLFVIKHNKHFIKGNKKNSSKNKL